MDPPELELEELLDDEVVPLDEELEELELDDELVVEPELEELLDVMPDELDDEAELEELLPDDEVALEEPPEPCEEELPPIPPAPPDELEDELLNRPSPLVSSQHPPKMKLARNMNAPIAATKRPSLLPARLIFIKKRSLSGFM